MPDVKITVNEQTYSISCGEGEEDRVKALGDYLDKHVAHMSRELGNLGTSRLLLLASLNICDELFAAREQLMKGRNENPTVALLMEDAAERIEKIAHHLNGKVEPEAPVFQFNQKAAQSGH